VTGSDIVGVAEKLGPLALWLVLLAALAWLLWDKVLGKEGLITRTWHGFFNRELARARRDAEIEAAQQLRHDARNAALLEENAFLEKELRDERRQTREAADRYRAELAAVREELAAAREQLQTALEQLAAIRADVGAVRTTVEDTP